jgi:hypothetical protein
MKGKFVTNISFAQQNNLFAYIHIGLMVYAEEKVRKCAFKVL